ncbi:dimethylarginine dimethylaminohydrolase family protein [Haliangium ochraceum]|uniref:arginine deiminase n=1 Tax=Haliangium ochraceum (strain DSM 14365 / JCM 11303 / SMP-2) TaxID=502025 RepID=D0LWK4_HALO1|nr:arginine deiminase-related protein [Haliangium ochraceum]ACY17654.1 amidinotransferase [Haliangium ochraceum DSM 14365]
MSYPPATWRIRGAKNFRSTTRKPTNPRAAGREWLALADAIERAGARVAVMPPADLEPPLTGMVYTANAGALFPDGFLVSRMWASHRDTEAEHVSAAMEALGVPVRQAEHVWEGQADICTLPGNRYILTYGVRSVPESAAEVRARLPEGARVLEVEIREPYFHGDTCMASLATPKGPVLLLCHEAIVSPSLDEIAAFAEGVEVLRVSEADTLAYACNALAVGTHWLAPRGLSEDCKQAIAARGLEVVELELSELFGKGGGGPRCMVNELDLLAPAPELPEAYALAAQRQRLGELIDGYPESAERSG